MIRYPRATGFNNADGYHVAEGNPIRHVSGLPLACPQMHGVSVFYQNWNNIVVPQFTVHTPLLMLFSHSFLMQQVFWVIWMFNLA